MKRTITPVVAIFAMAVCFSSFAQEKLPEVKLSGGAWIAYGYFDGKFIDAQDWDPASVIEDPDDGMNVFIGRATLEISASLGEKATACLVLENGHIGNEGTWFLITADDMIVCVGKAYITIKEVWDPNLSFIFGIPDLQFEPVKEGISPLFGTALLLNPTESESPWLDIGWGDGDGVYEPGIGEIWTTPFLWRDTSGPVGARFDYDTAGFKASVLLFPAVREGEPAGLDETLYGVWGSFPAGVAANDSVFFALTLFSGSLKEQDVWTAGVGINVPDIGEGLGFYAECYLQTGQAGRVLIGTAVKDLDAKGRLIHLGANYTPKDAGFWAGARFLEASGDDDIEDDEQGRFLSYEDNDDFIIIESDDLGLDIDTNYRKIAIELGTKVGLGGTELDTNVVLKVGSFSFKEDIRVGTAREDKLGMEWDLNIIYAYNKHLSFLGGIGFLTGSDALELVNSDKKDSTRVAFFGTAVTY